MQSTDQSRSSSLLSSKPSPSKKSPSILGSKQSSRAPSIKQAGKSSLSKISPLTIGK